MRVALCAIGGPYPIPAVRRRGVILLRPRYAHGRGKQLGLLESREALALSLLALGILVVCVVITLGR